MFGPIAFIVSRISIRTLHLLCFFLYVAELIQLMLIICSQLLVVVTILLLMLLILALKIRQNIVQPSQQSHKSHVTLSKRKDRRIMLLLVVCL